MTDARLATGLWVAAYLNRLRLAGIAHYLTHRGDATAGAVVVKLALLDGTARAFERGFDLATGARLWRQVVTGAEAEVDAWIARSHTRDRDLWVIEVEDRQGRTLLEEDGLSE